MSALVSRASQVHQMPQIMRPQIDPVIRLPARKASPTSVTATAVASQTKFLVMRKRALATKATRAQVSAVMAIGRWKKMILKMAPWLASGGRVAMTLMFLARRMTAKAPRANRSLSRIQPRRGGLPAAPGARIAPVFRISHDSGDNRVEFNVVEDVIEFLFI